jgi:hypothetical protein
MITHRHCAFLVIATLASATSPLLATSHSAPTSTAVPGWPATHDGRTLTALPLTAREQSFADGFPGRIARFTDGRREIILRHVTTATRRLHPASDCYKGLGYEIEPLPLRRDANGQPLGCFSAHKGETRHTVCEGLRDTQGAAWSDISQWYWDALLGQSKGPWWSIVVADAEHVIRPENPDP